MIYFMFHFGRSGSTVLTNSIGQHEKVFWHGEIFSQGVSIGKGFEETSHSHKQGGGEFTLDEFVDYIRTCMEFSSYDPNKKEIYGCEIKSYHFEFNKFKFTLTECLERLKKEFTCQFLFLERENAVRRILSCQIANQNNVWHLAKEAKKANTINVNIDDFKDVDLNYSGHLISTINNSFYKQTEYSRIIKGFSGKVFLYEEDIQDNVLVGVKKLASLMGLSEFEPEVRFRKTNPKDLKEIIINYDQFEDVINKNNLCRLLK